MNKCIWCRSPPGLQDRTRFDGKYICNECYEYWHFTCAECDEVYPFSYIGNMETLVCTGCKTQPRNLKQNLGGNDS